MSEPTPPSAPAPAPPEPASQRPEKSERPEKEAPTEVKRAITLYTATAAFLIFMGVTALFMIGETERELRRQMNEMEDDAISAAFSPEMIRATVIMFGVILVVVAVGHGLTAQALRDRKSWARPVGFTFSGILLAVAGLALLSGAVNIQTLFFLVAGLAGILNLAKPQVREYLQPWPRSGSGPGAPGGPGGWPPTPGGPGGSWHQPPAQQPPGHQPPQHAPGQQPPGQQPTGDQFPGQQPTGDQFPGQQPTGQQPTGDQFPGHQPPHQPSPPYGLPDPRQPSDPSHPAGAQAPGPEAAPPTGSTPVRPPSGQEPPRDDSTPTS